MKGKNMKKNSKRKGKLKMWIPLIIIGIIGAGLGAGLLVSAPGRREVKELVIDSVDFSNLRDGTYRGEYVGTKDHSRDTTVEVTITGGKITAIKIIKGAVDKEGKALELTKGLTVEDLYHNVLQEYSLDVDVISGATLTSKVHLKALENALKKAVVR